MVVKIFFCSDSIDVQPSFEFVFGENSCFIGLVDNIIGDMFNDGGSFFVVD